MPDDTQEPSLEEQLGECRRLLVGWVIKSLSTARPTDDPSKIAAVLDAFGKLTKLTPDRPPARGSAPQLKNLKRAMKSLSERKS